MRRSALAFAVALGCGTDEVEDDDTSGGTVPYRADDDTATDCGQTPPVIVDAGVDNTGIQTYENDEWPTLTFWATASPRPVPMDLVEKNGVKTALTPRLTMSG